MPLFLLINLQRGNYITGSRAEVLDEIRKYNANLSDLLLKRMLRGPGNRIQDAVIAGRRVFDAVPAQD